MNPQVASALILGFAATTAQIMIVRELTSLFAGFDPSLGAVYAAWLMWTGLGALLEARLARHAPARTGKPRTAALLALLGALLPLTLAAAQAARPLWSIPLGQFPGPLQTLGIALALPAPLCLTSGALFSACWNEFRAGNPDALPVYMGESLGAALGGLAFYFLIIPHAPGLGGALGAGLILCGAALFLSPRGAGGQRVRVLALIPLLGCLAALIFTPGLDRALLKLQWGPSATASAWTPYHNLAALRDGELTTFAADGLRLYSRPDPEAAQWGAHLPLLMHPNPGSVLLIGGDLQALAREMLKHPSVTRIDFVNPDPDLEAFVRAQSPVSGRTPGQAPDPADTPGVRIHHQDAAPFLAKTRETWDVAAMNLGDPVNAESNRFFTVEFYRSVRKALKPGGVFAFPASAAPDALGPVQERFLRSLHATLNTVFPRVLVVPGADVRFLASADPAALSDSAEVLARRMESRGVHADYVRPDSLADRFSPFRTALLRGLLNQGDPPEPNHDFRPTALFNGMMLWATAMGGPEVRILLDLRDAGPLPFWLGAALALVLMWAVVGKRPGARARAVAVSVFATGGTGMALCLGLLFSFRVAAGGFYGALALITGANMAGLGLGAGLARHLRPGVANLCAAQGAACLLALALEPCASLLAGRISPSTALLLFLLPALASGCVCGAHFGIASQIRATGNGTREVHGGVLYGADLLGGMLASTAFSLVLLPLCGLFTALAVIAVLGAANLALTARTLGGATA